MGDGPMPAAHMVMDTAAAHVPTVMVDAPTAVVGVVTVVALVATVVAVAASVVAEMPTEGVVAASVVVGAASAVADMPSAEVGMAEADTVVGAGRFHHPLAILTAGANCVGRGVFQGAYQEV